MLLCAKGRTTGEQLRDPLDVQVVGLSGLELMYDQSSGVLCPVAPKEEANVLSAEALLGEPLVLPSEAQRPPTCSAASPGIPSRVWSKAQPAEPAKPEFQLVYVRKGPLGGSAGDQVQRPLPGVAAEGQGAAPSDV